jgi:FtsP/CotA-like multicopper oxidase with cupredoxin domain
VNRRAAAAAIAGPSNPDPRPLTAAAIRHRLHPTASTGDAFPRHVVAGLPHAQTPIVVPLRDGDTLPLWIGSVQKQIGGRPVRLLAYNGSIPGPLLRVAQGSDITVDVTNNAGFEQSVHWHGLPVDNRSDGLPRRPQQPIPVLGMFTYRLQFPDPGLYWYHPHVRAEYGQQLGLYGQIIVDPAGPGYWPQVNREIPLTLDDVLITEDGEPAFDRFAPPHTMMRRYGTVLLVNGEIQPSFPVTRGEVIRLYLTNTATTRVVNMAITGAALSRVGDHSGRYEREDTGDTVRLAPSESAIVDVLFDTAGHAVLEHHTPDHAATLATFIVAADPAGTAVANTDRPLRSELQHP